MLCSSTDHTYRRKSSFLTHTVSASRLKMSNQSKGNSIPTQLALKIVGDGDEAQIEWGVIDCPILLRLGGERLVSLMLLSL